MCSEIAVVGGGTAGLLTVMFLRENFNNTKINWYKGTDSGIGVGEGTTSEPYSFLKSIGIDENILVNEINGTLKYGIQFNNWTSPGSSFFHPFGDSLHEKNFINFCKRQNIINTSLLSCQIAAHFKYEDLHRYAINNIIKKCNYINLISVEKTFDSLKEALIIDCTGFEKSIISRVENNFINYDYKLPNNRAVLYRHNTQNHIPYTLSTAADNGWFWTIPLKDEVGFGHVYSDKFHYDNSEFLIFLQKFLGTEDIDRNRFRELSFLSGRNKKHLVAIDNKIVCSIGLSSCFIEPLEATGISLAFDALLLLKQYIIGAISIDEYNIQYNASFDEIADFIVMHYKYNKNNNEYWSFYKTIKTDREQYDQIEKDLAWEWVESCLINTDNKKHHEIPVSYLRGASKSEKYNKWYKSITRTA